MSELGTAALTKKVLIEPPQVTEPIHDELVRLRKGVHALPFDVPGEKSTGMYPATGAVHGPGFFPGTWGSVDPTVAISSRPIMVLAQDQDNSRSFGQTVRSQNETHSPTWEEMLKVFQAAGLSPSHCFFTNFIPGIRWLATRNTAPSPALAHPAMMRACAAFFIEQFQVQQPKLIITLGKLTFTLLGLVSSDWRYRTAGITEFKDLDDRDMLINHNVAFDDAPGSSVTVVPLYHPCDIRNGAKRNFSGKHGIHNEVELLAQALTCLSAPRE